MKRQSDRPARKLLLLAVVCTLCLVFTESAAATDITYRVDVSVAGGSVMGTITTDGTRGPLRGLNIVSFNLTLFDGEARATLMNGVDGGEALTFGNLALTATPTQLMYDFNLDNAAVDFQATPCPPVWSLQGPMTETSPCTGIPGTGMIVQAGPGTHAAFMSEVGTRKIGTASAVPEPGSLGLMVTGLLSLIGLCKRRS